MKQTTEKRPGRQFSRPASRTIFVFAIHPRSELLGYYRVSASRSELLFGLDHRTLLDLSTNPECWFWPVTRRLILMQQSLNLQEWFGGIDIYLFDQLLKGRLVPGMRVLDAGCGSGRNLVYLLRSGFEVCGVDASSEAVAETRRLASEIQSEGSRQEADGSRQAKKDERNDEDNGRQNSGQSNFRVESVERMSWEDESFDVVLSSAVLHFARSEAHWQAMMNEMWRVLKPGGIFFARLASTIGIETQVELIEGRRYRSPDGGIRFLVDEAMLLEVTAALGGAFLEPIKTTLVQNMRAMTTICLRKGQEQRVKGKGHRGKGKGGKG